MRSRSYRYLLTALAVIVAGAIAFAQDQEQGREFHWKGKLAAENVVMIKNINGDIDAEPASGDEVEITAEKSGPEADQVKIEVVNLSDGIMVCAIYPGWFKNRCDEWHAHDSHGDKTKVHFTVKVPGNLRFEAENVNGSVDAAHMGRFVKATSVNGSVRVSTKSWAELSTVNGSIDGSMGSVAWNGKLKAESVNGSITLQLPENANMEVSFSSVNGRLDSDFPLTISGKFGGHSVRGTIGSGGRNLRVETVNGDVHLRKGDT
jgi:DUF4097 and DUF4098 domain-containing protein YvlB